MGCLSHADQHFHRRRRLPRCAWSIARAEVSNLEPIEAMTGTPHKRRFDKTEHHGTADRAALVEKRQMRLASEVSAACDRFFRSRSMPSLQWTTYAERSRNEHQGDPDAKEGHASEAGADLPTGGTNESSQGMPLKPLHEKFSHARQKSEKRVSASHL
jgi:hypothetical protein